MEEVTSSATTSLSTKAPPRTGHPFDGLRALLIALVVAGHFELASWMAGGQGRVVVFFVLSGFLITAILLKKFDRSGSLGFKDFYYSRLARFAPTILLVTLISLAASLAHTFDWWRSDSVHIADMSAALPSLWTQTVNIALQGNTDVPYELVPSWSLGIEWQFYLMWPVAMLLVLNYFGKKTLMWSALAVAVTSYAWSAWLVYFGDVGGAEDPRISFGADTRGGSILLGCALAIAVSYPQVRAFFARFAVPFVVLGGAAIAFMFTLTVFDFGPQMTTWGQVVLASVAGLVVASLWVRPGAAGGVLTLAPLVWIGQRSLGIFLLHVPVVMVLGGLGGWEQTALAIGVTLVVAGLSYRFLDQPLVAWAKRRAAGRSVSVGRGRVDSGAVVGSAVAAAVEPNKLAGVTSN